MILKDSHEKCLIKLLRDGCMHGGLTTNKISLELTSDKGSISLFSRFVYSFPIALTNLGCPLNNRGKIIIYIYIFIYILCCRIRLPPFPSLTCF